jgi:hypothetical protein
MLANWLSNIKWALLLAIVAGPGFAVWSFMEMQTFQRIGAEGTEAAAVIDGGESRSGRRSGTTYKIHAIWDANGTERAENITISSEYAGKIIDGDYLLIESAQIKYLPNEPSVEAVVVEDLPQRIADAQLMIYLGIGAGVVGLIGSAIFFLTGRKKKEAPKAAPSTSTSGLGF